MVSNSRSISMQESSHADASIDERPRARLRDVAALAGVSPKTASRVLAGEPNVSPERRERVIDAAKMLRFRPNRLAKDLRSGAQSSAVSLVVADLSNPFYSAVSASAEKVFRAHGLDLFLGSTQEDPEYERLVVTSMLERRTRAMLVVPSSEDHSYLQFEASLGTPLVFLDRPPVNLNADYFVGNDRAAAREAMTELAAFHRRCAVIGDTNVAWTARERLAGVREAVNSLDSDLRPTILTDAHHVETSQAMTLELLASDAPPTAFFGLNNLITLGILKAVRQMQARVTVVGFDDSDAMDLLGVSAIALSPIELGTLSAERILARIDDPTLTPAAFVLPFNKIVRTPLDQPIPIAKEIL